MSSILKEMSFSMPNPIQLHAKIRERHEPRISASALAEFVIVPPDRQDDILHDARFLRPMAAVPYSDALRAIRAYCNDPHRSPAHLDAAQAALSTKSHSTVYKPSVRDEADRCVEAIELFINAKNSFGLNSLPFVESTKSEHLAINGVSVSIQPDVIISASAPPSSGKIGGAFFRPQKRPDHLNCKTEETKSGRETIRREIAKYMLVLLRLSLIQQGYDENLIEKKWLLLFDLRTGERIEFPSDRAAREKRLKAACGQIAKLWSGVEPKPGDLQAAAP